MFIYYVLMKPYSWWIRINCRFLALHLGFGAKWNSCHLRTIRKKLRVCFSFTFECKRILLHWGKHCGWQQKWGRSALWWEHYLLTGDFFKGAVISCDLTKSVLCVFFWFFLFFFLQIYLKNAAHSARSASAALNHPHPPHRLHSGQCKCVFFHYYYFKLQLGYEDWDA